MGDPLIATDEASVRDAVGWAVSEKTPIEIMGGGTKRALGRPMQVARGLSLAGLSGIEDYEPSELVMTAWAGTSLAEIEAALAANGQRLAFEPPDYRALLGGAADGATIGAVFSCNLAGPRRTAAGAARDHLLGIRGVNGRAEIFKAGGRVVKNVTGFDLCKLVAGSFGTLAALTQVTFRVFPIPEAEATVLVMGLLEQDAVAVMIEGAQSPHEVSGAAHLPAGIAALSGVSAVGGAGRAVTALRVEGPAPSVAHRVAALGRCFAPLGEIEVLEAEGSQAFWREVRDVTPFAGSSRLVWRLAIPPAGGAAVVAEVGRRIEAEAILDRGGCCVWLATAQKAEEAAGAVRDAAATVGGSATLIRAPETVRAHADVFPPLAAGLRDLTARVKRAFDPLGLLNPGRMYAGL